MKLAVYAIAKNESENVERWFESVMDADEIVVLDTGSTDDTFEKLEALGVNVSRGHLDPFRFDVARNAALNKVGNVDYVMFLDFDEVLEPGAIHEIKKSLKGHSMYSMDLVFTQNADGSPAIWYPREAIHRRMEFFWQYPVHEVLTSYSKTYSHEHLDIKVYHVPDVEKDRTSYVNLLEMGVAENPDDPRCMQYLGREYFYEGRWLDAIMWLRKHIEVETHGPFRSESATYISQCYIAMEDKLESALDEAETWALRAIAEFNSAREPYCELASLYFSCGQYECAIGMLRSALRILKQPEVNMIHNSMYYGSWPHHLLAASYFNMGDLEKAKEEILVAIQMTPEGNINGSMLSDITKILGIDNVNQFIEDRNDTPSGSGDIPKEVSGGSESLSGKVSQE